MQNRILLNFGRILLIPITFLIINHTALSAQNIYIAGIEKNQPKGGIDFNEANKGAIKKLSQMSDEEIIILDNKLEKALTHFYDEEYSLALPIFIDISNKIETTDIMFWVGKSAMKSGKKSIAVDNFKKMLSIDPKLHRARLELATVYFSMDRYEEARKELETVLASSPPETVKQNIRKLLGAIDIRAKRFYSNVMISLGFLFDDNINSGPDMREYQVAGGTITPAALTAKISDEAAIQNIAGSFIYDPGKKGSLMWGSSINLYNKVYSDYSQFNFLMLDLATGPWITFEKGMLKLPVGYTEQEYESDRLSKIMHFDPSYEHYFSRGFSLKTLYSYSDVDYYSSAKSNLDGYKKKIELTPSFYFGNRKHNISISAGYEDQNSRSNAYSYKGPYHAITYITTLPKNIECYMKYHSSRKSYIDMPILYSSYRLDKIQSFTTVLSRGIGEHYFASFIYNYTDNYSSIDLFNYEKTTYTFNAGYKF